MAYPSSTPAARRSPALALAAMATVAVPGLDPVRLALPQEESESMRMTGVIDSQGRHWEVVEARNDAAGASLDAEAEVLRRLARLHDAGHLSFAVSRPAGSLREGGVHVQVRAHVEGRCLDVRALRPGPGLSAGVGRILGEIHELPQELASESGMPVYDAEDVRSRWLSLLDEVAGTGKVNPHLLDRWEQVLNNTALWRFRPTVVHGDLAEDNIITAGGAVVAVRGWTHMHVGDPAEDLAWLYSTAPVDCLDSIEGAYDVARSEGVDKHLRDRAELVSELSLAKWLMHGIRTENPAIIEDAVSMLTDLATQVGEEPLVEPQEPHLGAVPTPAVPMDAVSSEAVGLSPDPVTSEDDAAPATADGEEGQSSYAPAEEDASTGSSES